jgi:hypothetical protein
MKRASLQGRAFPVILLGQKIGRKERRGKEHDKNPCVLCVQNGEMEYVRFLKHEKVGL